MSQRLADRAMVSLVVFRAVGWALLALSVLLFFVGGKDGPQAAVHAFEWIVASQIGLCLVLAVARMACRCMVTRELWRFGSSYAVGACSWIGLAMLLQFLNFLYR